MTPVQKLSALVVLIVVLMVAVAGVTWQVQNWRMGEKLAEQVALHNHHLVAIGNAAATQARAEQDRIQRVPATCLPPPAPSAWFMQPVEPNLTQRMLNELSPSPTTATKD